MPVQFPRHMTITNFVCSLQEIHAEIVCVCVCVFSRDLETRNPGEDFPLFSTIPPYKFRNYCMPQIRPTMHSFTPFHNNNNNNKRFKSSFHYGPSG